MELLYCGWCDRQIRPLPGEVGEYRCPACGADLWRSTSEGRYGAIDHLHTEPGFRCSPLRCDRLDPRPVGTFRTVDGALASLGVADRPIGEQRGAVRRAIGLPGLRALLEQHADELRSRSLLVEPGAVDGQNDGQPGPKPGDGGAR